MNYINGGVRAVNGGPIATKAALKAAVRADPADVLFSCTAELGPAFSGRVTEMPEGVVLQVCGPDPYRSRKWYASVRKTARGFTVS